MLPFYRGRQGLACLTLLAVTLLTGPFPTAAQVQLREGRAVPRESYFLAFDPYYNGHYRTAMRGFRSALRSGIQSVEGRWVDSVCYYTMIGECLYQVGDLNGALEQYELALRVYMQHPSWMKRIQWPPAIQGAQTRQLPWGPSLRRTIPGQFPETLLSQRGSDVNRVLQQGGTLQPNQLYPVRVMEIMRCVGLSIRRRNEILGPLAPYESLTGDITRHLSRRQVNGNWISVITDVQLALAQLGSGGEKAKEAVNTLKASLAINQTFDHPLTAMALIEIGKRSLAAKEYPQALASFYEATFSAAQFRQADVLEEAFTWATKAHLLAGSTNMYPPLQAAAKWTQSNRMDRAAASILLSAAENAALLNQPRLAKPFLAQASGAMRRNDLSRTAVGTRLLYNTAFVAFQTGDVAKGNSSLEAAIQQNTKSSPRIFRVTRALALSRLKDTSPRVSGLMFNRVLREPNNTDWQLNPLDTLTYCLTPQTEALNVWLELGIERDEVETIVQVNDLIRRNKFYTQLKLGGRLLALRWILNAPVELLDTTAQEQRQALLKKFPALAENIAQIQASQRDLQELPSTTNAPDEIHRYEKVATQIKSLAAAQEQKLLEIALRPEPSKRIFPPRRSVDNIQGKLKPKQAVLIIVMGKKRARAILLTEGNKYRAWPLRAPTSVKRTVMNLTQAIGNYKTNHVLEASLLTDDAWKKDANQLFRTVFAGLEENERKQFLESTEELVIVPDGFFWYLPFELLQTPTSSAATQPLIQRMRIRYAPTASLAVDDPRALANNGETAIVLGRLFAKESTPIIRAAAKEIHDASAKPSVLRRPVPADSSILSSRWDRLVVLDDIRVNPKDGFDWAPAQIDERDGQGSKLTAWMDLPWAAPQQLILPGYITVSEDGLRAKTNGDELLVTSCGLMSAGVRTILLSRWRTGGQMSMELVREFMQESTQVGPAAAWQRSVQLARSTDLDPFSEPRIKGVQEGNVPKADHPFFWSGYMLIDSGFPSSQPNDPANGQPQ